MAKRRKITAALKARVWTAAKGICYLCNRPIAAGEIWEVEHVKPLSMGGTDEEENLRPAHADCHKGKTQKEVEPRTKADRIAKKHAGLKPVPKQKLVSRGFPVIEKKQTGVDKKGLPPLPRRNMFEDV
jgi:5-methylcytosine-specific restriction endonuclease McrA